MEDTLIEITDLVLSIAFSRHASTTERDCKLLHLSTDVERENVKYVVDRVAKNTEQLFQN